MTIFWSSHAFSMKLETQAKFSDNLAQVSDNYQGMKEPTSKVYRGENFQNYAHFLNSMLATELILDGY